MLFLNRQDFLPFCLSYFNSHTCPAASGGNRLCCGLASFLILNRQDSFLSFFLSWGANTPWLPMNVAPPAMVTVPSPLSSILCIPFFFRFKSPDAILLLDMCFHCESTCWFLSSLPGHAAAEALTAACVLKRERVNTCVVRGACECMGWRGSAWIHAFFFHHAILFLNTHVNGRLPSRVGAR